MADFYTIGKTDISDIYSRIRIRNERELFDRRRKLYTEYPELGTLDREITVTNTGVLRKIITLSPDAAEKVRTEGLEHVKELRQRFNHILQEHGYTPDTLTLTYDCPICKDEGFVNGQRCTCYQKHMMELLYRQSGLSDVLALENFSTFSFDYYSDRAENEDTPSPQKAVEEYHRKAKDFATTGSPEGMSFLFYGSTGVGKTFLSNCIAKEMMDRGNSVLYLTANELCSEILQPYLMYTSFEQKEQLKPVYDLIYNAQLLVLDDLGTELTNSFTLSQLFEIINRRMIKNLSTIISTNLTLQQLRERYRERIVSRIAEHYEICHFYGGDIRSRKKKESLGQ